MALLEHERLPPLVGPRHSRGPSLSGKSRQTSLTRANGRPQVQRPAPLRGFSEIRTILDTAATANSPVMSKPSLGSKAATLEGRPFEPGNNSSLSRRISSEGVFESTRAGGEPGGEVFQASPTPSTLQMLLPAIDVDERKGSRGSDRKGSRGSSRSSSSGGSTRSGRSSRDARAGRAGFASVLDEEGSGAVDSLFKPRGCLKRNGSKSSAGSYGQIAKAARRVWWSPGEPEIIAIDSRPDSGDLPSFALGRPAALTLEALEAGHVAAVDSDEDFLEASVLQAALSNAGHTPPHNHSSSRQACSAAWAEASEDSIEDSKSLPGIAASWAPCTFKGKCDLGATWTSSHRGRSLLMAVH